MTYSFMTRNQTRDIHNRTLDKNIDTAVFGCSFTTESYESRNHPKIDFTDMKQWPYFVSTHYGWNLINCALSGYSNEHMCIDAISVVSHNPRIKRVILGLSQWQRFYTPWEDFNVNGYLNWIKYKNDYANGLMEEEEFKKLEKVYDKHYFFNLMDNMGWKAHTELKNITDQLKNIQALSNTCRLFDVELILFQLLPFKPGQSPNSKKDYVFALGSDPLFEKINKMNHVKILGYPMITELGGREAAYEIESLIGEAEFRISDEDGHPSQTGHKEISKWFIENYNKCLK